MIDDTLELETIDLVDKKEEIESKSGQQIILYHEPYFIMYPKNITNYNIPDEMVVNKLISRSSHNAISKFISKTKLNKIFQKVFGEKCYLMDVYHLINEIEQDINKNPMIAAKKYSEFLNRFAPSLINNHAEGGAKTLFLSYMESKNQTVSHIIKEKLDENQIEQKILYRRLKNGSINEQYQKWNQKKQSTHKAYKSLAKGLKGIVIGSVIFSIPIISETVNNFYQDYMFNQRKTIVEAVKEAKEQANAYSYFFDPRPDNIRQMYYQSSEEKKIEIKQDIKNIAAMVNCSENTEILDQEVEYLKNVKNENYKIYGPAGFILEKFYLPLIK